MVYHCTGCNDYGEVGEAVYGLRVIHRHKLAFLPKLHHLTVRKNRKRSRQWLRFMRWLLGIKDLPKHTHAILFFSLPFFIAMTLVTIITLTDHRERIMPFENLKRYLAQQRKSNLFLGAVYYFFSLLLCSSCTFAQPLKTLHKEMGFNVSLLFSWLPLGILGILAFSKCAEVQRVHGA